MRLFKKKYKRADFDVFAEARKLDYFPDYPCHAFFEASYLNKKRKGELLPDFDTNLLKEFHKAMRDKR